MNGWAGSNPPRSGRIAANELGHALGFCRKSPSGYRSLMAPHTFDMPSSGAPTGRDRKNYRALWG